MFLPCFNTNSLTLQTSVYQVITALKCDYSSQIYLARGFLLSEASCQALPRWAQALNIQTWSGCCKSVLCPDKPYHVSGDEQRNLFWPEPANLPPQLYILNYSFGKWNTILGSCKLCPPKHRNLCLRIYRWGFHLPLSVPPSSSPRENHWTVDQVLSETLLLWILKGENGQVT